MKMSVLFVSCVCLVHLRQMIQTSVVVLQHEGIWTRTVRNLSESPNLVFARLAQWLSRSPGPVQWLSRPGQTCPVAVQESRTCCPGRQILPERILFVLFLFLKNKLTPLLFNEIDVFLDCRNNIKMETRMAAKQLPRAA